jgi:hypothetical protein
LTIGLDLAYLQELARAEAFFSKIVFDLYLNGFSTQDDWLVPNAA